MHSHASTLFRNLRATRDSGILFGFLCVRASTFSFSFFSFVSHHCIFPLPLFGSLMQSCARSSVVLLMAEYPRAQVSAPVSTVSTVSSKNVFNINDNDLAMISIYLPPLFRTRAKKNRWKAHQSRWMMCEHFLMRNNFLPLRAPHNSLALYCTCTWYLAPQLGIPLTSEIISNFILYADVATKLICSLVVCLC